MAAPSKYVTGLATHMAAAKAGSQPRSVGLVRATHGVLLWGRLVAVGCKMVAAQTVDYCLVVTATVSFVSDVVS